VAGCDLTTSKRSQVGILIKDKFCVRKWKCQFRQRVGVCTGRFHVYVWCLSAFGDGKWSNNMCRYGQNFLLDFKQCGA